MFASHAGLRPGRAMPPGDHRAAPVVQAPSASRALTWAGPGVGLLTWAVPCLLLAAALGGCALTPRGTSEQQAAILEAGEPYQPPVEKRTLPDLSAAPTWREVLQRAFLANGDLEAAYYEWQAAVHRIDMASTYPNANIMASYSYMFSAEKMKTFDRQTLGLGFDPSMNLSYPEKVMQKGKVALAEARAAGARFRAAKFDLQKRVLTQWADLRMVEQQRQVQREQVELSRLMLDALRARAQAGPVQRDVLRVQTALETQENTLLNTEAQLTAMRVMLNGMLGRAPTAPLHAWHDAPRTFTATDDQILTAAVDLNPEIEALAQQVQGRSDALELARLQWIPDITPSFSATGNASQMVGVAVMLPTTISEIRGGIAEARVMLRAGEAMLRQTRSDRTATLVATLVALRNDERQTRLLEGTLLPLAEKVLVYTRQEYATGSAMYLDLLEAQNMVLDTRLMALESRAERDKRLAELEALMGTDIETIGTTQPTTMPASTQVTTDTTQEVHHAD